MRKLLLILFTVILTSCSVLKPKPRYGSSRTPSSNGIIHENEDYNSDEFGYETSDPGPLPSEESYEIVVEPSYILDYESAPSYDLIYAQENTQIQIVEVNNRIINKETTNLGRVVYKIPTEMSVRTTHQVIVRISKSTVYILEDLEGEVKTTVVPITESMEVKLIDPSPNDDKMFEIVPDNKDGTQRIENDESITEWSWNVTPKRSGEAKLKIVISTIRDGIRKEKVYSDEVIVKSDIKKSSWYFIRTYWEWIMSSLVLPFIIWFFTKRKKKEEEED